MPIVTCIDGATIEVSDAAATEISKLQAQIRIQKAAATAAQAEVAELRRATVAPKIGDAADGAAAAARQVAHDEYVARISDGWKR